MTFADLGVVPVEATSDGTQLQQWKGDPATLTVRGELDKLASNISIGRDIAGVHWRSDYTESLLLGEAVAILLLCDQRATYKENFHFDLTTFRGQSLRIQKKADGSGMCITVPNEAWTRFDEIEDFG